MDIRIYIKVKTIRLNSDSSKSCWFNFICIKNDTILDAHMTRQGYINNLTTGAFNTIVISVD